MNAQSLVAILQSTMHADSGFRSASSHPDLEMRIIVFLVFPGNAQA